MKGWIKLHRRISDWEWYQHHPTLILFIHLLIHANHEDRRWRGVEVPKGHLITGINTLSKDLNLSFRSIRTALKHLKSTNEITIYPTNRYSLIKLNNWKEYQLKGSPIDKQPTSKRQATDHKQEGKKVRRKENKKRTASPSGDGAYNDSFLAFWNAYPRKIGKGAAWKAWKKIKGVEIFSLLKAVDNHKQQDQWTKDNGQYIPYPATWLNQRRWEDEVESATEEVDYT